LWLKGHIQDCEKEPKISFKEQIRIQIKNWIKKIAFYREPI
jgi:predicted XRE-type DNA-binding protein